MRKFYLLVSLTMFVLLNSCALKHGVFDVTLKTVVEPLAPNKSHPYSKIYVEKGSSPISHYDDKRMHITWRVDASKFYVELENKTPNYLVILWDGAMFMDDLNGAEHLAARGDNNFRSYKKGYEEQESIIMPFDKIKDELVPSSHVAYFSKRYQSLDKHYLFYNSWGYPEGAVSRDMESYVGTELALMIPMEINGVIKEFVFTFGIDKYSFKKGGF
ncbi:hypothetical protein K4L44_06490 [Halosquirtibacter laminarini]|uniref:Uncharacterized protein n=1 Tax=Halosquirtibacter laminarini TaxID=3374600 RepID=A0AC61NRA5_9BACT|nr:hypothetical protein K4L44_06490 [Prolixibacteraceae bacterium]